MWAFARRGAAVLAAALVFFLALFPTGRYLTRAAWEEAQILSRRRSIADLVTKGGVPVDERAKLELVLAARAFATDSLDLKARESFTTFSQLQHDTLVLLVSGTRRDWLSAKTWWFPIVGRVPYKGYFDYHDASAEAQQLESDGYDTYVRPASAFSTLGFFNDPVLSTTIRMDSAGLANTVIHELTHNTYYARGQTSFNESFASFLGGRGAEEFFRSRGDSALAKHAADEWADDKVLAAFWGALYTRVDSAFHAHPEGTAAARKARLASREAIYAEARGVLVREVGPKLKRFTPRALEHARIDNATLMARRVYATDLDIFDAVFQREGSDLRKAWRRIVTLAKSRPGDPFGAIREWLLS
ncbi:MAG: aminopeptidase [Gemmatimonadaceae bacterium]